jgi:hypothetical protein
MLDAAGASMALAASVSRLSQFGDTAGEVPAGIRRS